MWLAAALGFAFGFLGSVPVAGPIAVIVVSKALDQRYARGFWIAVGASVAEGVYAFLAFWGFSSLLEDHAWVEPAANGLAAVALLVLGVLLWRKGGDAAGAATGEPPPDPDSNGRRVGGSLFTGFFVTALNPTLLATWTGAATALFSSGLIAPKPEQALPFAAGVAGGIVAWFAVLLALIRRGVSAISPRVLGVVIRATGVVVVLVGLVFLGNLIF